MSDRMVEVLQLIRTQGPVSRSLIARELGLSPAAVSMAVSSLLEANLLVLRNGTTRRGLGRRPELLEFNPASGYVLGLDLGARHIRAAAADLAGTIVRRVEFPTLAYEGGQRVVERLEKTARELIEALPDRKAMAIGLASPGVLLPTTGRPWLAPFIPELQDIPLKEHMEQAFACPILMENDVDMAVLGELAWGAGQGSQNVVFVNIGIGLAAGIVLNGRLVRGSNRAAGEIGFMVLDPGHVRETFSETGATEAVLSGPGIVRRYRVLAGDRARDAETGASESERVFALARSGDAAARQVIDESVRYLAMVLANLAAAFNPERLIVGGGVGLALFDEERITGFLQAHVPFVPQVVLARLGGDASLMGAISCAVDAALQDVEQRLTR
ncbi:ROK family transcriptional regulator [Limnochorda pilosa]|uniref:Glucokinase n=1 Tax=Limnochorda pilosa TaxID=1555112 RepID=A0A0K2SM42_LIMPI|nr:ROK family transcriptional regulator [Limnochorda pilosa]BAS27904.1 glucokinase [Limnochorda pilosa]